MTKSELEILQPLATKTFYPLMIGAEEGREGGRGGAFLQTQSTTLLVRGLADGGPLGSDTDLEVAACAV